MTTRTKRRYWRSWPTVKINASKVSNDYKSDVAKWAMQNNIAIKIRTSSTYEEIIPSDPKLGTYPNRVYTSHYDIFIQDPQHMMMFMLVWAK